MLYFCLTTLQLKFQVSHLTPYKEYGQKNLIISLIISAISMEVKVKKEFDTVAFFRAVKARIAKATEGMSLQEERNFWKQIREGKVKLA
jgi:hypothetical protein